MTGKKDQELMGVEIVPARQNRTVKLKESPVHLTEQQAAFAVWLAEPEISRVPATIKEFAELVGVAETTVWRWSKRPDVQMAVRYLLLQTAAAPEKINAVLEMYEEVFSDKSQTASVRVQAGKEYLDAVGLKHVFNAGQGPALLNAAAGDLDYSELSDDELDKMLDAYSEEL